MVSRDYIIRYFDKLKCDIASGSLLQISRYIDTVAGAVVLVSNDAVYGELVMGEPRLILRTGLCKHRLLLANGIDKTV
ncbi:hypothetical protein, partial [Dysgonomonas capnocytophagoides]|uniref:hypothetical protein n=1 Tax=Dysgonomonas capnocytophagoides TaxID=45254 RepID=UPI002A83AB63